MREILLVELTSYPLCICNSLTTSLLASPCIVKVVKLHVRVKSSSSTIEPAVVYLCAILLELHKAIVDAVLIVIAIKARCSSNVVYMELEGVK